MLESKTHPFHFNEHNYCKSWWMLFQKVNKSLNSTAHFRLRLKLSFPNSKKRHISCPCTLLIITTIPSILAYYEYIIIIVKCMIGQIIRICIMASRRASSKQMPAEIALRLHHGAHYDARKFERRCRVISLRNNLCVRWCTIIVLRFD